MERSPLRRRLYRLQPRSLSMDSDLDPSCFPFDLLPIDIQSRILGLLPITTLVVCRAVSPSWRSIISSPDFLASYRPSRDPIFLLWTTDCFTLSASAYLPSADRWIDFHFPQSIGPQSVVTCGTLTSSGILSTYDSRYYIVRPFSAPHPIINFLPRSEYHDHFHFALAFIEYSPSDYKILLVSPCPSGLVSQIYHSRSGKYGLSQYFPHGFSSLKNAIYLDGLIFCLSSRPDRLLSFNLVTEEWAILDLHFPLPSMHFHHLLIFGGELYLTAAVEELFLTEAVEDIFGGEAAAEESIRISRVGIWELDRSTMTWREFDFMPAEYFTEFSGKVGLTLSARPLKVVDCMGMICFLIEDPKKIVMCDLAVRKWWCPQPCNIPGERRWSMQLAIEPRIDLLK